MTVEAGRIVLVDWRDALPKEPNKMRPAIVIEDSELFDPAYPNVIVVPLADDANLVISDLSLRIPPSPDNGCAKTCFALAQHVTTASKRRVTPTASFITPAELADIRRRVGLAIGLA